MTPKEKYKIPNWLKLDNAATIYPSTLTRKYASMFRMTITLDETVDWKILNEALVSVVKRFPSFRYELKKGLFWCYFKKIKVYPKIQDDYQNPMLRINFKKNDGFMFRVRCFDKRIAIEYFHALTDGTGGITFLLTLTGEYIKLKYKTKITYNDKVLNPHTKVSVDEYSDSFKKFARKVGGLEHEKKAYHYSGTLVDSHILNIITGIIPVESIKKICKEYDCTVTHFLTALMIISIQELQMKERNKIKRKRPIKVLVPINLRNIYPTKTMRNFSTYVNIGIDTKYGEYSLTETINLVKHNMGVMMSEKRINAKITGNVKIAKNIFIRLIPMFIKKYILSMSEYLMGDRYCSQTLSNIGVISLPEQMCNHIQEVGFILGKSRGKPGATGCVSYNGNLYISFSRKIKEPEFERIFFTQLVQMGIPVQIESNTGR